MTSKTQRQANLIQNFEQIWVDQYFNPLVAGSVIKVKTMAGEKMIRGKKKGELSEYSLAHRQWCLLSLINFHRSGDKMCQFYFLCQREELMSFPLSKAEDNQVRGERKTCILPRSNVLFFFNEFHICSSHTIMVIFMAFFPNCCSGKCVADGTLEINLNLPLKTTKSLGMFAFILACWILAVDAKL